MHEYAAWSKKSSDLWPELASSLKEETGIDVGHHRPGGLELCLDEDEFREFENAIARMHNQPGVGENGRRMIYGDEVRKLEPHVGPEVVGASYCPHDGVVNPLLTLRALHRQCKKTGVDYRPENKTLSIGPDMDGFKVNTTKGSITGHRVVLAAGNGNRELGQFVGLDIPVSPQRGHIVVTERVEPLFNHVLGQIRQTDEGTVMLGATAEDVGFDTSFNFDMAAKIVDRAIRKVPSLKTLKLIRSWSALRIMSPDGFPIYEESSEHKKNTRLATSIGLPNLIIGILDRYCFFCSSFKLSVMEVVMKPGEMIFTLMFLFATSRAIDLYRPTRPDFEAT